MKIAKSWKIRRSLLIFTISSIVMPVMTLKPFSLLENLVRGVLPSDPFYASRIFSLSPYLQNLGDFYVDDRNFTEREHEVISLGETLNRFVFKYLTNENSILTYYTVSFLCIVVFIALSSSLILGDSRKAHIGEILLLTTLFVLTFGSWRVVNTEYPFSRIISPQFHTCYWLLCMYFLQHFIRSSKIKKNKSSYLWLFLLILFGAYATSVFLFLIVVGTSLTFSVWILKQDKKVALVIFCSVAMALLLAYLRNNSIQSEERFNDALLRQGLIDDRFPGAIFPVSVLFFASLLIAFSARRQTARTNPIGGFDDIGSTLLLSNFGIIVATQSNVVSGKSIQFSDHFDIFALVNLILAFSYLLGNLKRNRLIESTRQFNRRFLRIAVVSVAMILAVTPHYTFIVAASKNNEIKAILHSEDESRNVIVDSHVIRESFTGFSGERILFERGIFFYGFTNTELLRRLFVSVGCPSTLKQEEVSQVIGYRISPYEQRAQRIESLNYFNWNFLKSQSKRFSDKAISARKLVDLEIDSLKSFTHKKDCLEFARQYGVSRVYFGEKSRWKLIGSKSGFQANDTLVPGLYYFDLN